jgi:predicted phosphodiesterase
MLLKIGAALISLTTCGFAQLLTPAWVELGPGTTRIARVVIAPGAACPEIEIDGRTRSMTPRGTPPAGFVPACETIVPDDARRVSVNGTALALGKANPSRMVVFGDTGCRLSGKQTQDCNDPKRSHWPFLKVAAAAAAEKPDVMIHVGDYLYREVACAADKSEFCQGTPWGDNWETWKIDFFEPAAPLLGAAPWIFVRGNHEDCERAWQGWFYYLDPHPWSGGTCDGYQAPYRVSLGSLPLVVVDTSSVGDKMTEAQVDRYAAELSALHVEHAWLASHHPFWGFSNSDGPTPSSPGLIMSWQKARLDGVDLLLAGHVHLFELLNFDLYLPPQLVAGQGGTELAKPIEKPVAGMAMGPAKVVAGATAHEYGYTVLNRSSGALSVELHDLGGNIVKSCGVRDHQVSCDAR